MKSYHLPVNKFTLVIVFSCILSTTLQAATERCELATGDGSGRSYCNNTTRTQTNATASKAEAWTQLANDLSRQIQDYQKQKEAREKQEEIQRQLETQKNIKKATNSADTNPWDNQSKKELDVILGECIQQNFSMHSNNKFSLKNICDYPINVKYTFSSSKPLSGTYTTLQPSQSTFETGHKGEVIKYRMCPLPKVPQSLNGACI